MKTYAIAALACASLLAAAGCKKTADNTSNYKSAIDTYYSSRPACLFADSVQFPKQIAASDTTKAAPYQALVDQGLLTRTTDEKKKFIVLSEQVTNYDLSDKGRSAWTASQTQPGYGNFCYGTRSVSSIDSSTPTSDKPGDKTTVQYHAGISGAPGWATAAETQNAFPQVRNDVANAPATAVLTDTSNGWAVTRGPNGTAAAQ
jgi:hypothetical protein